MDGTCVVAMRLTQGQGGRPARGEKGRDGLVLRSLFLAGSWFGVGFECERSWVYLASISLPVRVVGAFDGSLGRILSCNAVLIERDEGGS